MLPFDVIEFIRNGGALIGLLVIGAIVFAESGLLIGFFLPGDTLLLGAGILAAQGILPIGWTIAVIVITNILGNNAGYSIGRRYGPRLFKKKDGILFRQEYVQRAELFYKKHGGKTITLARFVPIIRTFAPLVAGVAKMDRKLFTFYNILGSLLWGVGITLLGYYVGSRIPGLERYLEPVLLGLIVITFAPIIYHILREERARKLIAGKLRAILLLSGHKSTKE